MHTFLCFDISFQHHGLLERLINESHGTVFSFSRKLKLYKKLSYLKIMSVSHLSIFFVSQVDCGSPESYTRWMVSNIPFPRAGKFLYLWGSHPGQKKNIKHIWTQAIFTVCNFHITFSFQSSLMSYPSFTQLVSEADGWDIPQSL